MPKLLELVRNFRIPVSFKNIRILFVVGVVGLFAVGLLESFSDEGIIWKEARNESGELAWNLLIFTIFISLLGKLFPMVKLFKQILPLRKEAGILIFTIICGHTFFHFMRSGVFGDLGGMLSESTRSWVVILGLIAFLIMLPLTITSNRVSVKKLGYPVWKYLHKTTHIVFVLAALHVAFTHFPGKGEIDFSPLVILGAYVAGYSWLFFKRKQ